MEFIPDSRRLRNKLVTHSVWRIIIINIYQATKARKPNSVPRREDPVETWISDMHKAVVTIGWRFAGGAKPGRRPPPRNWQ
jgi:hypothetical protein